MNKQRFVSYSYSSKMKFSSSSYLVAGEKPLNLVTCVTKLATQWHDETKQAEDLHSLYTPCNRCSYILCSLKFSRVKNFKDFNFQRCLSGLDNFTLKEFDPSKTPLKTYFTVSSLSLRYH